MKDRIAFVYYPHAADQATLATMPMAKNIVLSLAAAGWAVDLFLWGAGDTDVTKDLGDAIRVRRLPAFKKSQIAALGDRDPLNVIRAWRMKWQVYSLGRPYKCVFGVGQLGAHVASVLASFNACPFFYVNDELPSHWQDSVLRKLERVASRNAAYVIVPDEERFPALCEELQISRSAAHAVLPNLTLFQASTASIDWHRRMAIDDSSRVFLCAGSIADWSQIPELLSTLPYWPEGTVLVVHGRTRANEQYQKQIGHLEVPGKLFWSYGPVEEEELNTLVASSVCNVALYRNTGPNIETIGLSSGKIGRSLYFGRPVIASNHESLKFINDEKLGVLVTHPAEIPAAVTKILEQEDEFRSNCVEFSKRMLRFETAWSNFTESVRQTQRIDLSCATAD